MPDLDTPPRRNNVVVKLRGVAMDSWEMGPYDDLRRYAVLIDGVFAGRVESKRQAIYREKSSGVRLGLAGHSKSWLSFDARGWPLGTTDQRRDRAVQRVVEAFGA